jgi:hypothetical protein
VTCRKSIAREQAESRSACFMPVSSFAFSSTQKMEAVCSSKRLLILRTTGHYFPEDRTV